MMLSAALAAFLSLCLLLAGSAQAWVVTSYYQHSLEVQTYQRAYSTYTTTYTYQEAVKPTVSSFAPVSIETTVDSYDEITVVNVLVPTGVATVQDGYNDNYDYYNSRITYYVDITLTANTRSCLSNDWVWKTSYPVDVPFGVTPTAASIVTQETRYSAFGPTSTYTQAFLNPTDIPSSSLSSMSSYVSNSVYFEYSCTVSGSYRTGLISERGAAVTATGADLTGTAVAALASATSSGDNIYAERCLARLERNGGDKTGGRYGYDNGFMMGRWEWCDENSDCECYRGLPWWALIPIIWGSWIGLFLLIGLLESWFRFRSLCRGRSARRGMPIAWTLIFIPWTCFFLCCLKRGFQKKSPEEQKILEEEWKAMGFWRKIGRWLKWGFRYKYPSFLGPAPFRRTKWEEKDIAAEAQRRLSVSAAPMAMAGVAAPPVMAGTPGLPVDTPLPMGQRVENHPNGYYAPQQPPRAHVAPGVGATDFAEQGGNRQLSEGQGSLPVLPPVAQVSPVSPIEPASSSIAGPAPRSPKGNGKAREDLRGNTTVGV